MFLQVLSPEELEALLLLCGFNLSKSQVQDVLTNADVNHDGKIDSEEFVSLAMDLFNRGWKSYVPLDLSTYSIADLEVPLRVYLEVPLRVYLDFRGYFRLLGELTLGRKTQPSNHSLKIK